MNIYKCAWVLGKVKNSAAANKLKTFIGKVVNFCTNLQVFKLSFLMIFGDCKFVQNSYSFLLGNK